MDTGIAASPSVAASPGLPGGQIAGHPDPEVDGLVRIGREILTGQTPRSLRSEHLDMHRAERAEYLRRQTIIARLLAKGMSPAELRERAVRWGWIKG